MAQGKGTAAEERRRPNVARTAAEDAQHRAGRAAHETPKQTEARRGPHQRAVEAMTGGDPYLLTRAQAETVLTALGHDPVALISERTTREGAVDGQGNPVTVDAPAHHQLQAKGDLTAKLIRHYVKWLQPEGRYDKRTNDDIAVTIPLSAAELKTVNGHLGKGKHLTPFAEPAGAGK